MHPFSHSSTQTLQRLLDRARLELATVTASLAAAQNACRLAEARANSEESRAQMAEERSNMLARQLANCTCRVSPASPLGSPGPARNKHLEAPPRSPMVCGCAVCVCV